MRFVLILKDGQWVRSSFRDLVIGDKFRLYDEPDKPAYGKDQVYLALSDPYKNSADIYTINCSSL